MPTLDAIANRNAGRQYGYPINPGQPTGVAAGYPVPPTATAVPQASSMASSGMGPSASSPAAVPVSWVALLAVFVLIRVAYERGAKID